MNPEERHLVTALFDRLSALEDAQRDPEAERLIRDGLRQAPNAPYALVQTVLVQDEALRQADARIRELEEAVQASSGNTSFLGSMRDSLLGRAEARASVPSVPAGGASGMSPAWTGTGGAQPRPGAVPAPAGGSFLGTAAAAAAGVIGGSLLLGGIRNAMAQGGHRAFEEPGGGSPWGGGGGELAREAGLDDIGQGRSGPGEGGDRGVGLLDDDGGDGEQLQDDVDFSDDGGDFGDLDLGGDE
jgi:hypothetical protein